MLYWSGWYSEIYSPFLYVYAGIAWCLVGVPSNVLLLERCGNSHCQAVCECGRLRSEDWWWPGGLFALSLQASSGCCGVEGCSGAREEVVFGCGLLRVVCDLCVRARLGEWPACGFTSSTGGEVLPGGRMRGEAGGVMQLCAGAFLWS